MSSNDVASFLDTREKQKTFEDTIKRLSKNTQNGIQTTNKNFEDFCKEYYEKATEQVLEELKLFKGDELDQKTRSVIQNWMDWQYEKGIRTSTPSSALWESPTFLIPNRNSSIFKSFGAYALAENVLFWPIVMVCCSKSVCQLSVMSNDFSLKENPSVTSGWYVSWLSPNVGLVRCSLSEEPEAVVVADTLLVTD
jgi:hypothetical protein